MNKFENPVIKVVRFSKDDIVSTSSYTASNSENNSYVYEDVIGVGEGELI